jgi:hypothetical protein
MVQELEKACSQLFGSLLCHYICFIKGLDARKDTEVAQRIIPYTYMVPRPNHLLLQPKVSSFWIHTLQATSLPYKSAGGLAGRRRYVAATSLDILRNKSRLWWYRLPMVSPSAIPVPGVLTRASESLVLLTICHDIPHGQVIVFLI